MSANGPWSRGRSALRPALEGSRPWAWLAAVVAAATAAAYLTAAAGPAASAPGRGDTGALAQPLSCGPEHYIIRCYSPQDRN